MTFPKKWYLFMIPIGLLILLIGFIYGFRKQGESPSTRQLFETPRSRSDHKTDDMAQLEDMKQGSLSIPEQLKLLSMPWGKDPFSLDFLKTSSVSTGVVKTPRVRSTNERLHKINLTGIVFFDDQFMALINDTGVREGDYILGFKVLNIKRDYIVLLDGSGDYYTLELK